MAISGRFIPSNPQKYAGNPGNIMFRSTWELSCMKFFDSNANVLKWASEEVKIPYVSPLDNLIHHYYPDFIVVYTDKNGGIQKELLEVKPLSQSLAEKAKSDRDKAALLVNLAKWKAADVWCKQRGMVFRVITEKSIFKQANKPEKIKKPVGPKKTSKTRGTSK
jgi:hypothetical protein